MTREPVEPPEHFTLIRGFWDASNNQQIESALPCLAKRVYDMEIPSTLR